MRPGKVPGKEHPMAKQISVIHWQIKGEQERGQAVDPATAYDKARYNNECYGLGSHEIVTFSGTWFNYQIDEVMRDIMDGFEYTIQPMFVPPIY